MLIYSQISAEEVVCTNISEIESSIENLASEFLSLQNEESNLKNCLFELSKSDACTLRPSEDVLTRVNVS